MNRCFHLATSVLLRHAARIGPGTSGASEAGAGTVWYIHPSLGLDAVVFLGVLSGDTPERRISGRGGALPRGLTAEELAALDNIGNAGRRLGALVGPFYAYLFSVNATDTFDDVLASAQDPEARLRPAHENTPSWNPQAWPASRRGPRNCTARIAPRRVRGLLARDGGTAGGGRGTAFY
jgi:hypothetical protein